MPKQMAAIGGADAVLGFSALGLDARPVDDAQTAEQVIFELARAGTAIIFVTEEIAEQIPQTLQRYAAQPYPAIIPIPSGLQSKGLGLKQLKQNVEKALGADILFGKEG
ncbi:MAG: V-type ATP synthase subunit F [Clostridia bacterium]|nr:V-type ATP synthase subunit F [Clostridia bacterium]